MINELRMKTLEVLIPTYRRPESAAKAIESCLVNSDPRISVRCNSNGLEPDLERFRDYDSRLIYTCFDSNKGVHANFLYLLQHTTARFCMLLSDEDSIDPSAVSNILDYLDNCPDAVRVVSCSVYDIPGNCFRYIPESRLAIEDHDLNSLLALCLVPTYISGLIFSVNGLTSIDLVTLLNSSMGNAYSHLDIAKYLLISGRLRLYSSRFVLKGLDICMGGDGYSHRQSVRSKQDGNKDLNPFVFGPKARTRQFYYSDNILCSLRQNINLVSYFIAKWQNFSFFFHMTLNSHVATIIDTNTTIEKEVYFALKEAKECNEYASSSWMAHLFIPLLKMPKPVAYFSLKIIGKVINVLNRITALAKLRNRLK